MSVLALLNDKKVVRFEPAKDNKSIAVREGRANYHVLRLSKTGMLTLIEELIKITKHME